MLILCRKIMFVAIATSLAFAACFAHAQTLTNKALSVSLDPHDGSYTILRPQGSPVLKARVAAEVDYAWLHSSDLKCQAPHSTPFQDDLGSGKRAEVRCASSGKPDLIYDVDVYDGAPYAALQVTIRNTTSRSLSVQTIRPVEAIARTNIDLGGPASQDRVLSDSFSEDRPDLQIYDLGKAPGGMHRAAGSQLIYNRQSHTALFLGALTSERWLTLFHLKADTENISAFTVDSTGTTEIQKDFDLRDSPKDDQIELSLPLEPSQEMRSERLLFSLGQDYHQQLLDYADAIRRLHHARVNSETPIGWWSWTAYYGAINEGETLANADWQAAHLRSLGYKYFHIDEGYQYARGEFTTTNATQFPDGMRFVGHRVVADGLTLGLWTAPFEITTRSWVYEHHKDWLVHNAKGEPIVVGDVWGQGVDHLYVLDTTHPDAQAYLRETYKTIVREWGVRFIKLDFMDTTAVEGFYHRPHTTALEAQRIGLQIIRDTVGDEVLLDKDGSPMLNAVGLVECGRVSVDTGHNFERTKVAAPGIAARFYMHRNFFINDPDAFNVTDSYLMEEQEPQPPVTLSGAQASIALSAISGGMYEIGDDMLLLGSEKDRLALVENRDLLNMVRLGRAAYPVDLMSYDPSDEQPSIFLLRESRRQTMLVVFNWTSQARSHTFRLADLGLTVNQYKATDILNPSDAISVSSGQLQLTNQPAQSVKVIKLLDEATAAAAPDVEGRVPTAAKAGETLKLSAKAKSEGTPALSYHWDFGDGTSAQGAQVSHAYTRAGRFEVHLTADGVDGLNADKVFAVEVTGKLDVMPQLRNNRRFSEATDHP